MRKIGRGNGFWVNYFTGTIDAGKQSEFDRNISLIRKLKKDALEKLFYK